VLGTRFAGVGGVGPPLQYIQPRFDNGKKYVGGSIFASDHPAAALRATDCPCLCYPTPFKNFDIPSTGCATMTYIV
jgi:hypothetical protein